MLVDDAVRKQVDGVPVVSDVPVATGRQMAEVDRIATQEFGIALEALMENAAHQTARVVQMWLRLGRGRDVVALVGSGNNGGDALAALRWLRSWGYGTRAVLSASPERLKPLARRQLDSVAAMSLEVIDASRDADAARHALTRCDILIDGLLGYSAAGPPRGTVAELIAMSHDSRATIVAVDVPSGLDADTGTTPGDVVHANVTITLALPKAGLLAPTREVGTLLLADIGIPAQAFARLGIDTSTLFMAGDLLRIAPR